MVIVEILGGDAVDPAHFVRPADHRAAIGMREMQRSLHLLAHQRLRLVLHPHAAFFEHHIAFRPDMGVGQIQIGQTIRLQLHRQRQPVLGDLFVKGGVVMIGEGIGLAAILGDDLREGIVRIGLGAPKHHVFEEMRQAGNARRIVDRAYPKPQHLGGDGGAVIGDHQHLHAVLQRKLKGVVAGLARVDGRGLGQLGAIGGGVLLSGRRQRAHRNRQQEGVRKKPPRTSQTSRRYLFSSWWWSPSCAPWRFRRRH